MAETLLQCQLTVRSEDCGPAAEMQADRRLRAGPAGNSAFQETVSRQSAVEAAVSTIQFRASF
jgi:hypothetical protein